MLQNSYAQSSFETLPTKAKQLKCLPSLIYFCHFELLFQNLISVQCFLRSNHLMHLQKKGGWETSGRIQGSGTKGIDPPLPTYDSEWMQKQFFCVCLFNLSLIPSSAFPRRSGLGVRRHFDLFHRCHKSYKQGSGNKDLPYEELCPGELQCSGKTSV